MLAVVHTTSVLLSAMKKGCTTRTALVLARWSSSVLFACVCHVLLGYYNFEGGMYSKKYGIIITMAFVRLLLLLQLLLSTKTFTSREVKARNSFHFCLSKKKIRVLSHCSTWSNLTQEIQFLEFVGGSNSTHSYSNYSICMCFIRISTVKAMVKKLIASQARPPLNWLLPVFFFFFFQLGQKSPITHTQTLWTLTLKL